MSSTLTESDLRREPVEPSAAGPSSAPSGVEAAVTIIRPEHGWRLFDLRELWRFRELIYFLAWRDVKVRYKQTVFGAAWAILQPAMMMVVFTIFFGRMAAVPTGGVPYPLFAYAGLLPWTFFATAVANAGNSVVGSERMITKIYFPRFAIPLATVVAAVVDFVIALGLLLGLMLYYGFVPGVGWLLIPVLLGLFLLAALGVGAFLAALNVRYRDFRYVIPFLVQIWMFATPSVYMQPKVTAAADVTQVVMNLNPMTALISAFRSAALGGTIDAGPVGLATVIVVAVFLFGALYFRRSEDSFADVI